MAGGAGGIHHHGDIVVRHVDRRDSGCGGGQGLLVGAVRIFGIDFQQGLRQSRGLRCERLVVDQEFGRRISQDVFELRHGEAPVERQHDRAQPAAGELDLEIFGAVGRQQGHAVALADATRRQRRREPVDAPVKLGVGQFPRRLQIVYRELVRAAAGVMGDPVVAGRNARHGQAAVLPSPSIRRTCGRLSFTLRSRLWDIGMPP